MKSSVCIAIAQRWIGTPDERWVVAAPRLPLGLRGDFGAVAQLVERLHGMEEARGSIPLSSTISSTILFEKAPHRRMIVESVASSYRVALTVSPLVFVAVTVIVHPSTVND